MLTLPSASQRFAQAAPHFYVMHSSEHLLVSSKNFQISHEFEVVWISGGGKAKIVIGDFYGDPTCALVDADEEWCAVAGLGLIVYFIAEPFEPYQYNQRTNQYIEVGRDKGREWAVKSIRQVGPSELQLTLENGILHNIAFQRTDKICTFSVL